MSSIDEGDPIAPQTALISAGLHERDVYIAAALSNAPIFANTGDPRAFLYKPEEICDRVLVVANCMMARKEGAK